VAHPVQETVGNANCISRRYCIACFDLVLTLPVASATAERSLSLSFFSFELKLLCLRQCKNSIVGLCKT